MLTEQDVLTRGGIDIEQMASLIVYKDNIVTFLRDIQQSYIIKRGLTEWNEVKLMGWIECIDDIIDKVQRLEDVRNAYIEAKRKQDEDAEKTE